MHNHARNKLDVILFLLFIILNIMNNVISGSVTHSNINEYWGFKLYY